MSFKHWFRTRQGMALSTCEQDRVAGVLSTLFGYHIVQIGAVTPADYLHSSRIGHKVICQLAGEGEAAAAVDLLITDQDLPFSTASIDVALVPHVLEFSDKPHRFLREIARILIGDGHVLILGFNPWSLWGLWRLWLAWRDQPPWNGHFYSLPRIRDWLYLLDFEIISTERFIFRPPLGEGRLMQRIQFMEKLGSYCWPYFGSVYMILARKRVVPLTPIKMRWQKQRQRLAAGVVEPTVRAATVTERAGR